MPLNKAKGDMYPFVTHTWNAVKGKCPHACSYCYMKRWGKQPALHLDERELKTDLGKNNFIFIGSSCDMWADDVPDAFIRAVIERARKFENYYLFQTKNPARFTSPLIGLSAERDVLCTTIETNRHLPEIMRNAPAPFVRAEYLSVMRKRGFSTMVTMEPIMDFNLEFMLFLLREIGPDQVNIGADSGNNHLPEPPKEKNLELIAELEKFTTVIQKKNLWRLVA